MTAANISPHSTRRTVAIQKRGTSRSARARPCSATWRPAAPTCAGGILVRGRARAARRRSARRRRSPPPVRRCRTPGVAVELQQVRLHRVEGVDATPPVNGAPASAIAPAGFPSPCSIAPRRTLLTSSTRVLPRLGVKPMSRIITNANTNVTRQDDSARRMYGTPRFVACATGRRRPSRRASRTPSTISPLANTDSSRPPSNPLAVSASTSHASTAPEKNVKPSPRKAEAIAHAQNGAETATSGGRAASTTASVNVPSSTSAAGRACRR